MTDVLEWDELTAGWAKGEDCSNFQPVVSNWDPDQFAVMKATENCAPHAFLDPTFAGNWKAAKGRPRGAYHFFHPWSSPLDQADFLVDTVSAQGLVRGDFLVADVEITAGTGEWAAPEGTNRSHLLTGGAGEFLRHVGQDLGIPFSVASVNNAARVFLDRVATRVSGMGVTVWVYTNLSVGSELTLCTGYPLWVAFPSTTPPASVHPWHDWHIWQYAFGTGPHGGDRDEFHGTLDEMKKVLGAAADPPTPPTPVPPNWEDLMFAKIPDPVCRRGDNDAHTGHRWVHRVQGLLCASRLPVTIDGVYGASTAAGVRAVQKAAGIHENGDAVSSDTYAVLVTGSPIAPPAQNA